MYKIIYTTLKSQIAYLGFKLYRQLTFKPGYKTDKN